MNVLLVLCHPRRNSLTGQVADQALIALRSLGHNVEVLDLYRERFDPCVYEEDEPDWTNPRKQYSAVVQAEMQRVERNDALVICFPVWWWSVPAMLKGWFDRVWNYGWAYGDRRLSLQKGLMLGVVASGENDFVEAGYGAAMKQQLLKGTLGYSGIKDAKLEVFLDSLSEDSSVQADFMQRTQKIVTDFFNHKGEM